MISHAEGSAVPSVHTFARIVEPDTCSRTHCLAVVTAATPGTLARLVVDPPCDFHSWAAPSLLISCRK